MSIIIHTPHAESCSMFNPEGYIVISLLIQYISVIVGSAGLVLSIMTISQSFIKSDYGFCLRNANEKIMYELCWTLLSFGKIYNCSIESGIYPSSDQHIASYTL